MRTNIISEEPITLSEVKSILEKTKKNEEDLNFRAAKTYDFMQNTPVLPLKHVKELKKEIKSLEVSRLKDTHITKLIDIMPITPDDVKHTLNQFTLTVSLENRKKIAEKIEKAKIYLK